MRHLLILLAAALLAGCAAQSLPADSAASPTAITAQNYELTAAESATRYQAGTYTPVYAYNNSIPGPILSGTVGEPLSVLLHNELDVPTTIHWHGMRLENTMDGVPGVTQKAVQPGESFLYNYTPQSAGTYWYHSHVDAAEQVERGLYGPVIIHDPQDPYKDVPETILMLDDVLINQESGQLERFGIGVMHGRFGNILLVNGKERPVIGLPKEGTVRLRIINAANARTFNLGGASFTVIGEDIGPVEEPYQTRELELMPGQRYDVLINLDGHDALLTHRQRNERVPLALLSPEAEATDAYGTRRQPIENPFEVTQELRAQAPNLTVSLHGEMRDGSLAWTIDNKTFPDDPAEYDLEQGALYKVRLVNQQGQPHPMHLHGQRFKILARNGRNLDSGWRDMVMVGGGETVDIAFVAEEDGDWVFHCHILEHAEAGMLSIVHID